jgi:hypothetical protein
VTQADLRRGLTAAGLATDKETLAGLAGEAKAYQTKVAAEASLRGELHGLGRPVVELPVLPGGVTPEALESLGDLLLTSARVSA